MLCTFCFCIFAEFVRGEFVCGENFCGESAEKVFCAGFFLSPWFFCALRETFLGGGGPGGGVRGGGPGGPGGQNGQKRAKKGVFGGVRGGGPKWAVSVPEWYTSGSASTASHSTGWQKSPEYALIRIAAGPPFPGHFPPPGPPGKSHRFLGPLFGPPPQKRVPPPLFSPKRVVEDFPHHISDVIITIRGAPACPRAPCNTSATCPTFARTPARRPPSGPRAQCTPRAPRAHPAHTRRTHIPTPAHNILLLSPRLVGGAERPPDIIIFYFSRFIYFILFFVLILFIFMLHALRYAKSHSNRRGKRLGRAQIPQRSEEEFCGTLGPTLGPLCASSPWPKRPPKRVPRTPPKGSPGPPKKDPPKGPPEIPKAKGEG